MERDYDEIYSMRDEELQREFNRVAKAYDYEHKCLGYCGSDNYDKKALILKEAERRGIDITYNETFF